jgi:sortase (surface protein transpeptidase)
MGSAKPYPGGTKALIGTLATIMVLAAALVMRIRVRSITDTDRQSTPTAWATSGPNTIPAIARETTSVTRVPNMIPVEALRIEDAPPGHTAIGRIRIPSLAIDLPIVPVSWHLAQIEGRWLGVWDTVPGVAGYHRGTAGFGESGNCVLSAHSRQGDGFYGLWDVTVGNHIEIIGLDGSQSVYIVESVHHVAETGASLAERKANAAQLNHVERIQLTLITCWPDWAYTHRIIVTAVAA